MIQMNGNLSEQWELPDTTRRPNMLIEIDAYKIFLFANELYKLTQRQPIQVYNDGDEHVCPTCPNHNMVHRLHRLGTTMSIMYMYISLKLERTMTRMWMLIPDVMKTEIEMSMRLPKKDDEDKPSTNSGRLTPEMVDEIAYNLDGLSIMALAVTDRRMYGIIGPLVPKNIDHRLDA